MGIRRPQKNAKMGRYQEFEEALFLWFRQKREEGDHSQVPYYYNNIVATVAIVSF